ncbi:MAG TPA: MarR family transcriptional regulator [Verrucomicrobiae bacterium]|nr:MarR family transcriptional regulator [Verrucomicrobiae bacterium]
MPNRDARRLAEALVPISRLMRRHMQSKTFRPALSHMELHALGSVWEHDRPLMRDLSHALSLTPSATSSLVNGLVKRGLLDRKSDPKDRRALRLSLTKKGRAVLEQKFEYMAEGLQLLTRGMSVRDREELIRLLASLTKSTS